jgi:DNA modification methylase
MRVELWSIEDVKPYSKNPRRNEHAVEAVVQSIAEFGFRQPIVVDKQGVIVVGDTRYKAALRLCLKKVPVHVATGLTPTQVKAYRIADNKTAELAEWDEDGLVRELSELQKLDFDTDLLGFSADELQGLLDPDVRQGLVDPDEIPAPPEKPVSKAGDLWILGNHRLRCGDASKGEDMERLLNGERVHLVNTDPPYNVKVEPRSHNAIVAGLSSFADNARARQRRLAIGWRRADTAKPGPFNRSGFGHHPDHCQAPPKKLRAKDRPLANDDFTSAAGFERPLVAWFTNIARVLQPGRAFYIWGGYANIGSFPAALKATGLYFSQAIIWVKEHPVLNYRKDFMGNHEWCFYGWREGKAHQFFGPNNATDVWPIKKVNPQNMLHLTEKPVELAARAMHYSSRPGENVLDLFAGSGSTLIAAEQTGRRAFLMEIDPLYCDVIVRRWQQYTGKKAKRQRCGVVA